MTDELRLSDAEREAAAADLGEHFAQGRLSVDEHSERLEQVWDARTRGQIAPIFHDLPSPYAAAAPALSTEGRRGPDGYWSAGLRPFRRGVPTPLVLVLALLILATVVTHLPLVLIGLGVFWFVAVRHRGRSFGRRPGWR